MAAPEFVELVSRLAEAMGQRMDAVRRIPEGLLLKTSDGFLFAFLEDPNRTSLQTIQQLFNEVPTAPPRLVVLSPGRLPLALGTEVVRRQGTLVEDRRFHELVRGLGLGSYLGDEPKPAVTGTRARLLPSALELDTIMGRARTWLEWGVPALALRFFRQANELKPEFVPARIGIGRSLLALGLITEADRTFDGVLALDPKELDARLGKAAVLGAGGEVDREVAAYREILDEVPGRIEVRANLIAALIAQGRWPEARAEIETILEATPEDPSMRFLHSVALDRTGESSAAGAERDRARTLGLDAERERALCLHLGLPPPARVAPPPGHRLPPAPVPPAPPVLAPTEAPEGAAEARTPPAKPVRRKGTARTPRRPRKAK